MPSRPNSITISDVNLVDLAPRAHVVDVVSALGGAAHLHRQVMGAGHYRYSVEFPGGQLRGQPLATLMNSASPKADEVQAIGDMSADIDVIRSHYAPIAKYQEELRIGHRQLGAPWVRFLKESKVWGQALRTSHTDLDYRPEGALQAYHPDERMQRTNARAKATPIHYNGSVVGKLPGLFDPKNLADAFARSRPFNTRSGTASLVFKAAPLGGRVRSYALPYRRHLEPAIAWQRAGSERSFVYTDNVTSIDVTLPVIATSSSVLGVLSAAALSPEVVQSWPQKISYPGAEHSQLNRGLQATVFAQMRSDEVLAGSFIRAVEAAF